MKSGQKVKVYDGDLVGFTTATLEERNAVVKEGLLERWTMTTEDGTKLTRFVKPYADEMKDGCGYLMESPKTVFVVRELRDEENGELLSIHDVYATVFSNREDAKKHLDKLKDEYVELISKPYELGEERETLIDVNRTDYYLRVSFRKDVHEAVIDELEVK